VERAAGYRQALADAGLAPAAELEVAGNFSLQGGAEAMQRLLTLDDPPTAVFACSDEMAIGAMQVAQDAGLRVPANLSIVGFDDHEVAEFVGLTTIRQDVAGLGERAAQLLLELLDQPDGTPSAPVPHLFQPTRLVVRRTTGPPPAGAGYRW
jgi:DNA-binding LacI/PurR family transcriptional regulator